MIKHISFAFFLCACTCSHAKVLVIGDSISLGWQPFAQELLPDIEFVHAFNGVQENNEGTRASLRNNPGSSFRRIDEFLLQEPTWDAIVFNSGIHDMRSDPHYATTPAEYRENLETIFDAIDANGAPSIWLTTTPVPDDHPSLDHTEQPAYREQGLLAGERADAVVDLYDATFDQFDELRIFAGNLHFSDDGSRFLASLIVPVVASLIVDPDLNGDLGVDGQDYLWWQRTANNWSSHLHSWSHSLGATAPALAAVPEPMAIQLLAVLFGVYGAGRKRWNGCQ